MKRGSVAWAILAIVAPAVALSAGASISGALGAARTERVQFAKDRTSAAIKGMIRDDATVEYLVAAQAGQTMAVTLASSNASNHFNVTAPGTGTAMFVGSVLGNEFKAKLPLSGDYIVQVYLVRNAARKAETAKYTLTVEVTP